MSRVARREAEGCELVDLGGGKVEDGFENLALVGADQKSLAHFGPTEARVEQIERLAIGRRLAPLTEDVEPELRLVDLARRLLGRDGRFFFGGIAATGQEDEQEQ